MSFREAIAAIRQEFAIEEVALAANAPAKNQELLLKSEFARDLMAKAQFPPELEQLAIQMLASLICRYYQYVKPYESLKAEYGVATSAEEACLLGARRRLFDIVGDEHVKARVEALINIGFTSAFQIAAVGRQAFVEKTKSLDRFDENVAKEVYRKAWQKSLLAQQIAGNFYSDMSATHIPSLCAPKEMGKPAFEELKAEKLAGNSLPDYRFLFEFGDACECEWEESVHGPAA